MCTWNADLWRVSRAAAAGAHALKFQLAVPMNQSSGHPISALHAAANHGK
jgi:hypothetical protein